MVIERVFAITKAPTNSAIPANASRMYWRNETKPNSFLSSLTCACVSRTAAVGGPFRPGAGSVPRRVELRLLGIHGEAQRRCAASVDHLAVLADQLGAVARHRAGRRGDIRQVPHLRQQRGREGRRIHAVAVLVLERGLAADD